MVRRWIDLALAAIALVAAAPLLAAAALGIRLASPGPILYRAPRVGRRGTRFMMYKLRTMHAGNGAQRNGSVITAHQDPRVFPFGSLLRRTKLDELPQLLNVLRGDMAIIGPRPEDPRIVDAHYTPFERETLEVRPGLASPGSIYNYTHGDTLLAGDDPERAYVDRLLRVKLALDVVYVRRVSFAYDLAIMGRTLRVIVAMLLGRREFPDPPEMDTARRLLAEAEVRA
ncbi:MAG TPA: sugar transferase [bacterium]|nr:sugar transferase [bacterium]